MSNFKHVKGEHLTHQQKEGINIFNLLLVLDSISRTVLEI